MTDEGLPEPVANASPATQRVYDTLREADEPLTRRDLETKTRHVGRTIRYALAELRDAGVVEQQGTWPVAPEYTLADE